MTQILLRWKELIKSLLSLSSFHAIFIKCIDHTRQLDKKFKVCSGCFICETSDWHQQEDDDSAVVTWPAGLMKLISCDSTESIVNQTNELKQPATIMRSSNSVMINENRLIRKVDWQ